MFYILLFCLKVLLTFLNPSVAISNEVIEMKDSMQVHDYNQTKWILFKCFCPHS